MNGLTEAVVASQPMLRSSFDSSSLVPSCNERSSETLLITRPRDFTCRLTSS